MDSQAQWDGLVPQELNMTPGAHVPTGGEPGGLGDGRKTVHCLPSDML